MTSGPRQAIRVYRCHADCSVGNVLVVGLYITRDHAHAVGADVLYVASHAYISDVHLEVTP